MPSNRKRDLPTRAEILEFVEGADGKVGKREIARAFGVSGPERVALKSLLREMAGDGLIAGDRGDRDRGRRRIGPQFPQRREFLDVLHLEFKKYFPVNLYYYFNSISVLIV